MRRYRMRTPRVSMGRGIRVNFGKRGTSVTTNLGGGIKITTGPRGTTFTTTTRLGKGLSVTTQTRNGKTSTRWNFSNPFRWFKRR